MRCFPVAEFCNIRVPRDIFWHSCSSPHALHCTGAHHSAGKTLQVDGIQLCIYCDCLALWL